LQISVLPRRQAIVFGECPQSTAFGTSSVFELDQRPITQGAPIHPDVTIAHHRLYDVQPIRLAIHAHDLAPVAIGLDHVDEHLAIGDQLDERRASSVAIGLGFLRRVDVPQAHVDIAALRRPHQEAVTIEDASDRAREIPFVRICGA